MIVKGIKVQIDKVRDGLFSGLDVVNDILKPVLTKVKDISVEQQIRSITTPPPINHSILAHSFRKSNPIEILRNSILMNLDWYLLEISKMAIECPTALMEKIVDQLFTSVLQLQTNQTKLLILNYPSVENLLYDLKAAEYGLYAYNLILDLIEKAYEFSTLNGKAVDINALTSNMVELIRRLRDKYGQIVFDMLAGFPSFVFWSPIYIYMYELVKLYNASTFWKKIEIVEALYRNIRVAETIEIYDNNDHRKFKRTNYMLVYPDIFDNIPVIFPKKATDEIRYPAMFAVFLVVINVYNFNPEEIDAKFKPYLNRLLPYMSIWKDIYPVFKARKSDVIKAILNR